MSDIRPVDLATAATSAAADDYLLLDGATQGTRKLLAAGAGGAVEHYGASPTASAADNRTAILAALSAHGRALFVGDGVYECDPITLSAPAIFDLGRATLKLPTGALAALLRVETSNVVIRGGTLDGNDVAQHLVQCPSPPDPGRENLLLDGVMFVNSGTHPFRISGSSTAFPFRDVVVRNCTFIDCKGHNVYVNWDAPGVTVTHCRFVRSEQNAIYVGSRSHRAMITHNVIEAPGRMGIEVWGQTTGTEYPNEHVTVAYNRVRDGDSSFGAGVNAGISIDQCPGALVTGNLIENMTGSLTLEAKFCPNSLIYDNRVINSTGVGISVDSSSGAMVRGNYVADVGGVGILMVNAPSGHLKIIDNDIINSGSFGIEFANEHHPDSLVQGNRILSSGSRGITREGGTTQRLRVIGNEIYDPAGDAIRASFSDEMQVYDNVIKATASTARAIYIYNTTNTNVMRNKVVGFDGTGGVGVQNGGSTTGWGTTDALIADNDLRGAATAIVSDGQSTGTTTRDNQT